MKNKVISALLVAGSVVQLHAQSASPDFMRSIGKIYVVVATIVAIFIGIVILLIVLEKRISKLEKQIKNHE